MPLRRDSGELEGIGIARDATLNLRQLYTTSTGNTQHAWPAAVAAYHRQQAEKQPDLSASRVGNILRNALGGAPP